MAAEGDLTKLTADQIEKIDRLVERLTNWLGGEIPHAIKDYGRYIQLIRFVEPPANTVLMALSAGMPDTVRGIHVKLQSLLKKASQVDSLRREDADESRLEDANLLKLAQDLIAMLERMVTSDGPDTSSDEPGPSASIQSEHIADDTERDIIDALQGETLTGAKLAERAGYAYNFKFKSSLAGLRKRGILGNKSPGYFLEPEYEFLLKTEE
jgi:hypothetical protein